MKTVLVVSDSHHLTQNNDIYKRIKPDIAVHCGDSQLKRKDSDLSNYDILVKGNCDLNNLPTADFFTVENFKVLVVHGHLEGVNYGDSFLLDLAYENDCNMVLHGHTHIFRCVKKDGIFIINPGSLASSRSMDPSGYSVITFDESSFTLNGYAKQGHLVFYSTKESL